MKPRKRTQKPRDQAQKALETWVQRDKKCRTLSKSIRAAQATLKKAASDDVWSLYLALEEHINARHVEIVRAAISLATDIRSATGRAPTPSRRRRAT